ncbi:KPN_02809 family neutral zinc metallopeptidase [Propionicicella superfundia]|uniref:KPN_02809 family neutral zinc metallopeptidase n=1 Tax=Propionicicella superfundia TaxID=348582 RepID=UPI0003FCBAC9|nr:neutral zinc metallopeptidase [Propionicicella superfundia]
MQYNENAQLDPSQMGGGGGGRSGGKIALGGGAGLLVVILALVFGLNPSALLGDGTTTGETSTGAYAHCTRGSDISADRDCRFVAYTNSIQAYWASAVEGYTMSTTKTFTGRIDTACGTATSAVGPFYCPADSTVYLDTGFFDDLVTQLGAQGGDAAEAYVIAHEYGHHVSNLIGTLDEVQRAGNQTGATSPQVRLELQADCFAGVWLKNAQTQENGPISGVTTDDLKRAVDAAQAVGDDRIQEQTTGRVDRESWTHGSTEQRSRWLLAGYSSGNPNSCDTFSAKTL